jgi:soluble lytic murein transglycosylase-like protein
VSKKWRYPAALAATVGIAFPALAVAADSASAPAQQGGKSRHAGRAKDRVPKALARAQGRLHRTIDVQVHQIRTQQRRKHRSRWRPLPGGVSQATLDAIADCESGGNPKAVSAGGTYRGKYQFNYGTWASIGGHGDPAAASEKEQDYRAALLYERSGTSPWPVCG